MQGVVTTVTDAFLETQRRQQRAKTTTTTTTTAAVTSGASGASGRGGGGGGGDNKGSRISSPCLGGDSGGIYVGRSSRGVSQIHPHLFVSHRSYRQRHHHCYPRNSIIVIVILSWSTHFIEYHRQATHHLHSHPDRAPHHLHTQAHESARVPDSIDDRSSTRSSLASYD